jgi:hypothetical protein
MNLQSFMFPIVERSVAVHNGKRNVMDWENNKIFLQSDCSERYQRNHINFSKIVQNSIKMRKYYLITS